MDILGFAVACLLAVQEEGVEDEIQGLTVLCPALFLLCVCYVCVCTCAYKLEFDVKSLHQLLFTLFFIF